MEGNCPLCDRPQGVCRCRQACFVCGQDHPYGTECPPRSECEQYGHIFYVPGHATKTCQRAGCGAPNPHIRKAVV